MAAIVHKNDPHFAYRIVNIHVNSSVFKNKFSGGCMWDPQDGP